MFVIRSMPHNMETERLTKSRATYFLFGDKIKDLEMAGFGRYTQIGLQQISLYAGIYTLQREPCHFLHLLGVDLDKHAIFAAHVKVLAISAASHHLPPNLVINYLLLDATFQVPNLH